MKRFAALFCLLVILVQSLSTLYIFTSFQLNRNYISKNLCVNRFENIPVCKGQCYLAKKMKEQAKEEQKFPDLKKKMQLFCEMTVVTRNPGEASSRAALTILPQHYSCNTYHSSIFHPPPRS